MDPFATIRGIAVDRRHAAAALAASDDVRALLGAALAAHDLELVTTRRGSRFPLGVSGLLHRSARIVFVADDLSPEQQAFVIAHEVGHFHLHRDPILEVGSNANAAGPSLDRGSQPLGGYSPRELKEAQADVFAVEFLCPSNWIRDQVVVQRRRPREVADVVALPRGLVMSQAVRALLLPPPRAEASRRRAPLPWDARQRRAIEWDEGPVLVQGGPGTGKTSAMAARFRHLVERGATAASILALLPSEPAAETMRAMVGEDVASEAWIGTFQAFGRDMATKWPALLGRSGAVRILDKADAASLLAAEGGPGTTGKVADTLRRILRAKDDLTVFDEAVEKTVRTGHGAVASSVAADPAFEATLAAYQAALARADALDASDLVPAAVRLLSHAEILQSCRSRFRHVLVDSFEDATSAARAMLNALCAPGADLWVAGDHRQAVNRRRGAALAGMSEFTDGVGWSRLTLAGNKRAGASLGAAIEVLSAPPAAPERRSPAAILRSGGVRLSVVDSADDEAAAIAAEIQALRNRGFTYADQAILARSHSTLDRLAAPLARAGIPLLHTGDLSKSCEVSQLVSLVTSANDWKAFRKFATGPAYGLSDTEVFAIRKRGMRLGLGPFAALRLVRPSDLKGERASKLRDDFIGLDPGASASDLLCSWLFDRSDFLAAMLREPDRVGTRAKLLAIYHLIKLCQEHKAAVDRSPKLLARRIRQAGAIDQDTAFRSLSPHAAGVDAVRVMTIHASKGLEFRAVHMVGLSAKGVSRRVADITLSPAERERDETCEADLFRIGITRASGHLHLSRARSEGQGPLDPSVLIDGVSDWALRDRDLSRSAGRTPEIVAAA